MEKRHTIIKDIIEKEMYYTGHDLDHVLRVLTFAIKLAEGEEVDMEVLIPAVLLHDIARVQEDNDKTGEIDHAIMGAEMAEGILLNLSYDKGLIERIKHCIASHRYRTSCAPETIEAKILYDADKLDILGAVGIARSFMLAGEHGERLYIDSSIKEYKKNNIGNKGRVKDFSKHSSNYEFEMKLKKIPDRLYTNKAKEIAEKRLKFMKKYFKILKEEIDGNR